MCIYLSGINRYVIPCVAIVYIFRPENQVFLSLLIAIALAVVSWLVWLQIRHVFTQTVFTISAVFVYCHHAANKSVLLPLLYDSESISK